MTAAWPAGVALAADEGAPCPAPLQSPRAALCGVALALAVQALALIAAPALEYARATVADVARVDIRLLRAASSPAAAVSATTPAARPARPAPFAPSVPPPATTPAAVDNSAAPTAVPDAAAPTGIPPAVAPATTTIPPVETVARIDTRYDHNPAPFYPAMSRRLGESGEVLLRVRVGADGSVLGVEVERSSGYPRLDAAARAATAGWRFLPARRGDGAVESVVRIPLRFVLDS